VLDNAVYSAFESTLNSSIVSYRIMHDMLMYSWWAGFRRLPVEVQVKLAQDSVYPVTLIFHSQFYNLNTGEYNWFINTPQERDLVLGILPPFAALGSHFSSTGFALRSLSLTDVEMAFLAAMAVLTATGHVTFSLSFGAR